MTLDQWADDLRRELGVDAAIDIRAVLDLARDAAHAIERPAAPVTTFLAGYAAGLRGGTPEHISAALATAAALAQSRATGSDER